MKKSRKKTVILGGVLAILVVAGAGFFFWSQNRSTEKTLVTGHASWPSYTFQDAVDKASVVVYGKAGERGPVQEHETSVTPGFSSKEYYQEVSVESLVLGKGTAGEDGNVTYLDFEVETDTHIYDMEGMEPMETGKEYVLFLSDEGAILSPQMMIPVENGKISTQFLPEGTAVSDETLPVEEFMELVKSAAE